jgi:DNA mismatch repair protein MutL
MSEDTPSERRAIKALDDQTIQRIAAGEIVERPASVVKELVENALDAGADRISVAVEAGGTDGIRVRDDGIGMTADQLAVAVEEHTTSKIEDIQDLDAGVGTLGFRGEALHTIGAVSRLTLRSRPREGEDAGAEITVEGGDVGEVRPAGCPEGTTTEVEDLFFNTPARRKFLKTDATEFDHVNTVVTHYALANPGVAVSLEHDGRELFATQGDGTLRSAVLAVYGREVAESMIEVESTETEDQSGASVRGLVSHPGTTRSTREYLSTFVNDRYVTASTLREGVLAAYGGQLASDRYPFTVLFVDVPPEAVDVNVHPRKMEVRFNDESGVREAVEEAVRTALLDHGVLRSSAPRGRSQAAETAVSPESPEDEAVGGAGTAHEAAADASSSETGREQLGSGVEDDPSTSEHASADDSSGGNSGTAEGTAVRDSSDVRRDSTEIDDERRPSPRSWQETETGDESEAPREETQTSVGSSDQSPDSSTDDPGSTTDHPGKATGPSESTADSSASNTELTTEAERTVQGETPDAFAPPTSQRTLQGEDATVDREFETLPRLRVLGQLHDTYLVAETEDGMVLIDQHAADERINYERLQTELTGDTPTQALADPVELELTAREAALFEEQQDALAQLGFHAGRAGDRTVEVRTVPAVFDATLKPSLLRDVLTAFVREEVDAGQQTVDAVADSLLADLACYPSITGNTSLREGTVAALLAALEACENPYACPHGRPVIVSIDQEEIGDRFERDYPGHSHGHRD